MNKAIAIMAATTILALTITAAAQDEGMDFTDTTTYDDSTVTTTDTSTTGGFNFPINYSDRPLTLNKHAVRGSFRVTVGGTSAPGTFSSLDFGGSFGVLEDLEVGINGYRFTSRKIFRGSTPGAGIGLIPIIVAPNGDFGDIPIYTRYSFFDESDWELAVDGVLLLPSNTDFAFTAAMPVRFTGIDDMAIDLAAEFTVVAAGGGLVDLTFPVRFTFNFTDEIFLHGASGLGFTGLSGVNAFEVPLVLGGGYSLLVKDKVLMDFVFDFGFASLVTAGAPGDTVNAGDTWYIIFGVDIWSDELF